MKIFKKEKNNGWRIKFAFFPVVFDEWFRNSKGKEEKHTTTIWLERYWSRFEGLYYNVRRLEDKPKDL